MERFKDKVVLVTGGSRGMGLSHVKELIREGAQVYFTDILEEEGKAAQKLLGNKAHFIKQDVSSEKDWVNVAEIIEKQYGKLDVLIHNAGIAPSGLIETSSLSDYMKVINVNQVSTFLALHYCLPLLKKGENASVVNISSIAGLRTLGGLGAYSSSKFAVLALTQVAAQEWAPFKIRVNAVCPGVVDTPMVHVEGTEELAEMMKEQIPLKRFGQPYELTKAVLFLASEDSSFTTGVSFVVDGGGSLRMS